MEIQRVFITSRPFSGTPEVFLLIVLMARLLDVMPIDENLQKNYVKLITTEK